MVHSVRIGINIGKDVLVLKKALLIILIILLIGVFVFSGIKVAQILINYRNIDALYDKSSRYFSLVDCNYLFLISERVAVFVPII